MCCNNINFIIFLYYKTCRISNKGPLQSSIQYFVVPEQNKQHRIVTGLPLYASRESLNAITGWEPLFERGSAENSIYSIKYIII